MGACDWFKKIIGLKRAKKDGSKQAKANSSTAKDSNGLKRSNPSGKEPNSLNNGTSSRKAGLLSMRIEDTAATRIQTAFRAYMARKGLQSHKGAIRFQALVEGHTVRKQAEAALSHIHFWSNIQALIRARRLCMVTEARTRQKKLENQLKLEAKLHELEVEWCGGTETMEEILSRIQQREEAAVKRERTMAYAFSHQWRANSGQYFGQAYYDLGKENWGWSWMERWIAARPWETRVFTQPVIPKKKGHAKKGSSKAGKTTNQAAIKIIVSVNPPLSNGKEEIKATNPSPSVAGKQSPQEADAEVITFL